jgi:hypothetical protein
MFLLPAARLGAGGPYVVMNHGAANLVVHATVVVRAGVLFAGRLPHRSP